MVNQMNKHVNHLSMKKLLGIEAKEHGFKKPKTPAQQAKIEMKEHQLKKAPSMGEMILMEEKEHYKNGELIIGRGHEGRARKSK